MDTRTEADRLVNIAQALGAAASHSQDQDSREQTVIVHLSYGTRRGDVYVSNDPVAPGLPNLVGNVLVGAANPNDDMPSSIAMTHVVAAWMGLDTDTADRVQRDFLDRHLVATRAAATRRRHRNSERDAVVEVAARTIIADPALGDVQALALLRNARHLGMSFDPFADHVSEAVVSRLGISESALLPVARGWLRNGLDGACVDALSTQMCAEWSGGNAPPPIEDRRLATWQALSGLPLRLRCHQGNVLIHAEREMTRAGMNLADTDRVAYTVEITDMHRGFQERRLLAALLDMQRQPLTGRVSLWMQVSRSQEQMLSSGWDEHENVLEPYTTDAEACAERDSVRSFTVDLKEWLS